MPTLRKYIRLFFIFDWAMFIGLLRLMTILIQPFAPKVAHDLRRRVFTVAAKGVLWYTGLRVTVIGTPPERPYFLVSNHLTFLDVFVLASQLGPVFVSRADLRSWPFFGLLARSMNTIFIDRQKMRDTVRVNELIRHAMDEGDGVVVFPEGGVTKTGDVMPFRPALLEAAAGLEIPVHYAALHYATPVGGVRASNVARWHDGVPFFQHFMALASLPYFEVTLQFGDEPVVGLDRKELAEELQAKVSAMFPGLD